MPANSLFDKYEETKKNEKIFVSKFEEKKQPLSVKLQEMKTLLTAKPDPNLVKTKRAKLDI